MKRPARFHVQAWQRWEDAEPSFAAWYSDLETATDAAVARPEPLIDLSQLGRGMLAARRLITHPATPGLPHTYNDLA